MFNFKTLIIAIGAIATIIGVQSSSIGADKISEFIHKSETMFCEIEAVKSFGKTTLKGVIHSPMAIEGSYQLLVESISNSGSSSLSQGGHFNADANHRASFGRMVLGGQGLDYYATLTLEIDGEIVSCAEGDTASI